jgi:single-stranded DNA-binding protein
MEYRKYQKDGVERVSAEIIAHTLESLSSKDRSSTGRTEPSGGNHEPNGNTKDDFNDLPF